MKQFSILSGRCLVVELPEKHEAAFKALRNGRELTINRKNKSANVDHITFDFGFAEQLFNHGLLDCTSGSLDTGDRHYLFGLGWRIIGMLSEVTDEQAKGTVDEPYESGIEQYTEPDDLTGWIVSEAPMGTKYSKVMYRGYRDYAKDPDDYPVREVNPFGTALESLESAILAEGYYLDENPIAVPEFSGGNIRFSETVEYAKAQSRVLCRERCLLLRRVDG